MSDKVKQPKPLSAIKPIVAQNITKLMNDRFPDNQYSNRTGKAIALAKKSGLGKNTVLRIMDPDDTTSISIDNLEVLAIALKVLPYQLLIPYLNVDNPQTSHISPVDEKQQTHRIEEKKVIIREDELKLSIDDLKFSIVLSVQMQ